MGEIGSDVFDNLDDAQESDLVDAANETPVIRFVNLVLQQAIRAESSDVHFEPFEDEFRIRYRVDGALYDIENTPKLDKKVRHDIEVVIDRLIVGPGLENRLADSFETALALSDGLAITACTYPYTFWVTRAGTARYNDFQEKFGISYGDLQVAGTSERLDAARRSYQSAECVSDPSVALSDPDIDIVFISTPVRSHRELALAAIRNGKHVLVEKPLALDAYSAAELVTLADANGVLLAVDHTFVFTGAVRKLRELVSTGEIGDLRYFDSIRVNLGLVQPDINVLWDLAIHDLSILQFVTEKRPVSVSASGIAHSPSIHESTAYLTLFYEDDFIALRDQAKGLSAGEKTLYTKALSVLVSELAFSLNTPEEKAMAKVEKALS